MTTEVFLSLLWVVNALLACYALALGCHIHYEGLKERAAHPEFYERYDRLLR